MIGRRGVLIGGGIVLGGAAAGWGAWPGADPAHAAALAESRAAVPGSAGDWPADWRARAAQLVRLAALAGNSHNTQPWRFEVSEAAIRILPDPSRRCPVVDPEDRHLVASLGCAAENLALAAAAAGLRAEAAFGAASHSAHLSFAAAPPEAGPAYRAIPQRQSSRTTFDPAPLAPAELAALERAATRPGVGARLITDRAAIGTVGEAVIAGNDAQFGDPAFVGELLDWLRFTQSHAAETRDGLFAACSGNPVVPRWIGRRIFPLVATPAAESAKLAGQMAGTAGVLVLAAETDAPAGWFEVGRAAQRFQLEATAMGVRTSYVNQPVEVAAVREGFAAWLGDGLRPALVLRFGRGPEMPQSLRRPVAAVLHEA